MAVNIKDDKLKSIQGISWVKAILVGLLLIIPVFFVYYIIEIQVLVLGGGSPGFILHGDPATAWWYAVASWLVKLIGVLLEATIISVSYAYFYKRSAKKNSISIEISHTDIMFRGIYIAVILAILLFLFISLTYGFA